jgi:phosphoribosylformimino-5-aminoimidazole carboxamide ribotide isomerase
MRIIGVIDLLDGLAVQARAGEREKYRPVSEVDGRPIAAGDALALAHFYVERCGLTELYVADLDAILGRHRQDSVVRSILALQIPVLLDAGVSSPNETTQLVNLGVDRVVVALETLPSFDRLSAICAAVPVERVAFSLDLRHGDPVVSPTSLVSTTSPERLAARAVATGIGTLIVIDLARVGAGRGLDVELIGRIRQTVPNIQLIAGGGVRGLDDLKALAAAGCDGALVATALQDGRLSGADVIAVARPSPHARATR